MMLAAGIGTEIEIETEGRGRGGRDGGDRRLIDDKFGEGQ
jgi:hypothetical protein